MDGQAERMLKRNNGRLNRFGNLALYIVPGVHWLSDKMLISTVEFLNRQMYSQRLHLSIVHFNRQVLREQTSLKRTTKIN